MERAFKTRALSFILSVTFLVTSTTPGWTQAPSATPAPEEALFTDIPTVVTDATFFRMNTRQAPGTTYIVTSTQIDASAVATVSDVLQDFVPGVYTTDHGLFGALIGSRGITADSSSKTIYMIDGMDVDPRWHYGASQEAIMPFMGDIDKIEVTMGPGAIVHGSGAINGFINVIPKNGSDYPGWTMDTKHGFDENLWETQLGYGKSWGQDRDLYLFAGIAKSSGMNMQNSMNNTGVSWESIPAGESPYFKVDDIFYPALKFDINYRYDNFKLLTVFERNFSTPYEVWWLGEGFYHGMLAVNPEYKWDLSATDSITNDASMVLQDNYEMWQQSGQYQSGLQPAASAQAGNYYNVQKGDVVTDLDDANGASESYFGDKIVYRTEKIDKNQIAIGADVGRRDFFGNGFAFFWDKFGSTNGVASPHSLYSWLEYSLFAEDVISLTDKWTLTVGGREDGVSYPDPYVSYYDNIRASLKSPSVAHFSPSITAAYQVSPVTTVKASYNEGFRFPNAADVIRNLSPRPSNPNDSTSAPITFPAPGPETMDSYELDVHHDVKALKFGWDLNTYFNKLHNTLGWAQPGGNDTEGATYNSPDFDSIGYELVGKWEPIADTSFDASYSFSRPLQYKDDTVQSPFGGIIPTNDKGSEWARYPDQMIKLGATTKVFNKLTLHMDMDLRSGVKYDQSASDYSLHYEWLDHPSVVFNAAVKYDINRNWWVKFSVKNMTRNRNIEPIWGLSSQFYAVNYSDRSQMYLELGCKF